MSAPSASLPTSLSSRILRGKIRFSNLSGFKDCARDWYWIIYGMWHYGRDYSAVVDARIRVFTGRSIFSKYKKRGVLVQLIFCYTTGFIAVSELSRI